MHFPMEWFCMRCSRANMLLKAWKTEKYIINFLFKMLVTNTLNALFDASIFLFLIQIIKIVGAKINWNWLECSYRDDSQHLTKIYYKKLITTFRPDTPSDIIDIFKSCLWPFAEDRINFTQVIKKKLRIFFSLC